MEDDYREILAELDSIDEMLIQMEQDLESIIEPEYPGELWACVDHSNMCCTFVNSVGSVRSIGAQYIEEAMEGGNGGYTDSIHTPV